MFWGYTATRPYMTARWQLIGPLLDVNTEVALRAVYAHLMDTHRLCRRDNLGVRGLTPYVMIRLGRDQEAYDFVKWWATTSESDDYDPSHPGNQFLNVKGADAYEDPRFLLEDVLGIDGLVPVALIKCRLLHNLVESNVNPGEPLINSTAAKRRVPIKGTNFLEQSARLMQQISILYNAVHKCNKHIWTALHNPSDTDLAAKPLGMKLGSVEQMQVALKYGYEAWLESPMALTYIEAAGKGGDLKASDLSIMRGAGN